MALSQPDRFATDGVGGIVGVLLHALYAAARLPLLTLLVILEPVVRLLLTGLALLFVVTAVLLKLTAPATLHVPFWGMLSTGIVCAWMLTLYYWALRLLSA